MDIPVNAKVFCLEEFCGRSTAVILNPVNDQVTHVAVEEAEFPNGSRLVPVERIRESTPEAIRLNCTRAELGKMDLFLESEYIPLNMTGAMFLLPYSVPAAGITLEHEMIPPGELAFRRGSPVEAVDGPIGTVDEFLVEPKRHHITHLVLRKGHLWDPRDVTIPVGRIERIAGKTVYLKLSKAEVGALPAIKVKRRWL